MVEHTMHTLWRHAHQVLYPTEGGPVAAAIMSCRLISKLFESSLWLKNRGSCVQACGVIYEGTPLISSTFGQGNFFSKTSIYCKIKTIAFLFAFLFCFALFIVNPGLYWLWIKVSITVTPHEHHGVSERKTTPNKRPKLCITNPLWGVALWQPPSWVAA